MHPNINGSLKNQYRNFYWKEDRGKTMLWS